jgi:hypothetical protein
MITTFNIMNFTAFIYAVFFYYYPNLIVPLKFI